METTIYSRFKQLADVSPDHPAIIDERSCINYSGLDRLADTLISRFPTFIPARVGIVMDHSLEMIAALLAVNKSGAAFVCVEPDFPQERMRRFLTENGVDFVITQEKYAKYLRDFTLSIIGPQLYADPALHPLPDRSRPDRTAYIMYTQATTGYPIGVAVGNRQVVSMSERFGRQFRISPDDVLLQYSASIVNIFIEEVFGTLLNGAVLAIPSEETRSDSARLLAFADEQYVTIISGFPYLLHELNSAPALPMTLRLVISGGSRLSSAAIGNLIGQVSVYNTYDPASATVLSTVYHCNDGYSLPSGVYPLGKPMEGVEVMILDDDLNPVAPGAEGEICIAGDGVADSFTGDHRADQLSQLAVTPDGIRIARTGDIGKILPDGNVAYLHRKNDEVNILGKRVVTDEVVRALKATGEVKDCAVIHCADERGQNYLVAYVVPATPRFSLSWTKNRIAQFLPAYMIPEFFVMLRQLPDDASGQVNEPALPIVLKDAAG